ncbi:MAG: hypothetical protein QOC84_2064, partial [Bradyrhizobium sp.]|nr:hypothetical protein [Bradyrhizobium sp.]
AFLFKFYELVSALPSKVGLIDGYKAMFTPQFLLTVFFLVVVGSCACAAAFFVRKMVNLELEKIED